MATSSISTISRAVRDCLPEGKMTSKKMVMPAGEKFTPGNQVGYLNRVLRLVGLVVETKKKKKRKKKWKPLAGYMSI